MFFIPHGQFFETTAMDNGISFISQGLKIDIIGFINQLIHISPLRFHIGKVCSLMGNLFKIHVLVVLVTVAFEQRKIKTSAEAPLPAESESTVLLLNSTEIPGRQRREILGLVQGHTVYAIWLGKDLSALIRLVLGGELTEYTQMLGMARATATNRMMAQAARMGADAIINVRYMTTSVVGSAAELLVYGTAVKLSE